MFLFCKALIPQVPMATKGREKKLYTPQEIIVYYQKRGKLPPEMEKRVGK
jgi:hypothetical protein